MPDCFGYVAASGRSGEQVGGRMTLVRFCLRAYTYTYEPRNWVYTLYRKKFVQVAQMCRPHFFVFTSSSRLLT